MTPDDDSRDVPRPDEPSVLDEREAEGPPSSKDPMAALVKRAVTSGEGRRSSSILPGVQRRLRKRSRGKFFGDGWSTADGRVSHALIAAAMLLVLLIAYFALGPVGAE